MPVFFYNSLKNKPKQPFQPHLYLSLSFCARYKVYLRNFLFEPAFNKKAPKDRSGDKKTRR